MNSVKIIIPIYKTYFGELEEKSFYNIVEVLKTQIVWFNLKGWKMIITKKI
jgi:hypothetical protein